MLLYKTRIYRLLTPWSGAQTCLLWISILCTELSFESLHGLTPRRFCTVYNYLQFYLHNAFKFCAMHNDFLHCIVCFTETQVALMYIAFHIALHCFELPCTVLHCLALPCTALYCLALPCIAQPVVCDPGSSPKWLLQVVAAAVHLSVATRSASPGSLSSLLR